MTTAIYTLNKRSLGYRTQQFFINSEKVHHGLYDLSKVVYIKGHKKVIFICSIHGDFKQTPHSHLKGEGCAKCGKYSNTEEFKKKAKKVHNGLYNLSKVVYVASDQEIIINCHIHGDFKQTPNHHLKGRGCSRCSKRSYSKIAIKWLNSINSNIQHAENGGEYTIPNTRYKVDGYCKETNTVYEFHGDVYHGNLELFKIDENCHPFNKNITAKELYDNTIERENEIKSLGYNLVVMWENDYKISCI